MKRREKIQFIIYGVRDILIIIYDLNGYSRSEHCHPLHFAFLEYNPTVLKFNKNHSIAIVCTLPFFQGASIDQSIIELVDRKRANFYVTQKNAISESHKV